MCVCVCVRCDNSSRSTLFAQAVRTAQHLYTEGLQAGSTATCSLDSLIKSVVAPSHSIRVLQNRKDTGYTGSLE